MKILLSPAKTFAKDIPDHLSISTPLFEQETARLIKDDFLQQNSFTSYDRYCPFYKSVEMMKAMTAFHRLATQAVERTAAGNAEGQKITFNLIKSRCAGLKGVWVTR